MRGGERREFEVSHCPACSLLGLTRGIANYLLFPGGLTYVEVDLVTGQYLPVLFHCDHPDLLACLLPWPQDEWITVSWSGRTAEGDCIVGKGRRRWQTQGSPGPSPVPRHRVPVRGALSSGSFCWRLRKDGSQVRLAQSLRDAQVVPWVFWEQARVVW